PGGISLGLGPPLPARRHRQAAVALPAAAGLDVAAGLALVVGVLGLHRGRTDGAGWTPRLGRVHARWRRTFGSAGGVPGRDIGSSHEVHPAVDPTLSPKPRLGSSRRFFGALAASTRCASAGGGTDRTAGPPTGGARPLGSPCRTPDSGTPCPR